jgi:hypothetical protein
MKHLIGKTMTMEADFMGEKVKIKKLTVSEIMEIQEKAKKQKEGDEISTLRTIIKLGVEGAKELTDKEIESFPLQELTSLTTEVVKFSGLSGLLDKAEEVGN